MKVELLYFKDCPNWKDTLREVQSLLTTRRIPEPVQLVEVKSNEQAQELRFIGSPTVRINDTDIEGPLAEEVGQFNLQCRIYWVDGKAQGRPPREWLEAALDAQSD
jgi:hypothetical protein